MSAVTVYVPLDSAARSVGADEVAAAIAAEAAKRNLKVKLVRNGTRGLLWTAADCPSPPARTHRRSGPP